MAGRNPSPDLFETSTSDTDTSDSDKTLSPPPDCLPPWMRSSSETYSAQTPLAPLEPVIIISSESESEKLTNIQKASLGACKSDSDSDSEELCFGSPLKTPPKRPPRPPSKKKTTTPSYTDLEVLTRPPLPLWNAVIEP